MAAAFLLEANFGGAAFSQTANFHFGSFENRANFNSAIFKKEANFSGANFRREVQFSAATFESDADFSVATFAAEVHFNFASFRKYVKFVGDERTGFGDSSSLNLQVARIEEPRHWSFRSLALRPSWFVNVDVRPFEFTNVEWRVRGVDEEISNLRSAKVASPHSLLAMTYRRLALNAKENGRYAEASRFRYLSMDSLRRERWFGFTFWKLEWWYWAASGYGRSTTHAFIVLSGIWLFFAVLYMTVPFRRAAETEKEWLPLRHAIVYSLGVMMLQKPDPKPETRAGEALVLIETILGPLQAALFALAVRRKFQADLSEE